jgi:hypothetical protein
MNRQTRINSMILAAIALITSLAPAPQQVAPTQVGELKTLADARVKICDKMLDYYRESLKGPPAPGDPLNPAQRYAAGYEPIQVWSKRRVDAQLDGAADHEGRVKVLSDEVDRIQKFAGELRSIAQGQPEWQVVSDTAEFYRLEAEYRLSKEKASR